MPRALHVHIHGRARDAGTAHDPHTGQFTAGAGSSPSTRSEHAQQAKYHRGEEKRHEKSMYTSRNAGQIASERGSREMMHQHRKLAEHHEHRSKEETVPTGKRPIPKSQVSRVTKSLLGW